MRIGIRVRAGLRGASGLSAALVLALVAACQPSAPPGFTGTQPAASVPPGASIAVPGGSALVAGQPVVTTDGGKVTVVGLSGGKSPDFDLPAGSAQMVVTPCASNGVIPFVTLYDSTDTKLSIVVEPTYTLQNLTGGSYYLDVASNPSCTWQIEISPG
jgi:hypothetical protein